MKNRWDCRVIGKEKQIYKRENKLKIFFFFIHVFVLRD